MVEDETNVISITHAACSEPFISFPTPTTSHQLFLERQFHFSCRTLLCNTLGHDFCLIDIRQIYFLTFTFQKGIAMLILTKRINLIIAIFLIVKIYTNDRILFSKNFCKRTFPINILQHPILPFQKFRRIHTSSQTPSRKIDSANTLVEEFAKFLQPLFNILPILPNSPNSTYYCCYTCYASNNLNYIHHTFKIYKGL